MSNILPLAVGSKITDKLGEAGDYYVAQEGYYYDYYQLTNLTPGVPVTISMTSYNMDTWVGIINGDTGKWVVYDDNSGSGTNSLLSFTPVFGDQGNYYIAASSSGPNSTGTYSLSVS
jgi:hypothetical protein